MTELKAIEEKESFKIVGLSLPMFSIITVIIMTASYLKVLPAGMVGAFPLMMVLGALLNEIGNRTPIIKDYFGGGPIVVIFGSAAIVMYKLLPLESVKIMGDFIKEQGEFLSFYIAALITGSILGMERKLLIKASIRYLPVIIGGVIVSLTLVGTVGGLMGYGVKKAIFYIGIPIMGGGMGAGAVPLAKIFGEALKTDPASLLSVMIPAVTLGNAMAIVLAGLLDKIGKLKKNLSGEGKLLKDDIKNNLQEKKQVKEKIEFVNLGIGLLISTSFFILGLVLSKFIHLHSYALMIISVAIVKALGILPEKYEKCAFQWFGFVMTNLTPALLIGIGVAYTDLGAVINSFTPTYLILVFVTVFGAILGAGTVGALFNFYFIEASLTAGLCMANMGGTGDVAVLSAAKRMELMPFAQISSRIGGAFMLILATILLSIFS